jgi:hypothetical protein
MTDQGNKTTPCFAVFTNDQRLIGEAAENQTTTEPENTVFGNFSSLLYILVDTIAILWFRKITKTMV